MTGLVIFGLGRSGSTLLASLLNEHPAIHCDGEILKRAYGRPWRHSLAPLLLRCPIPYLTLRKFMVQRTGPSIYGFKLHLHQARHPERLIPQLRGLGWHIRHLERLSSFAMTISALVARDTRRYHGKQNQIEPDIAPFAIAPDQFLSILRNREQSARRCREIAASVPRLHLVYEHDLASPDCWTITVERICTHIGIEPPAGPVTTHLQKPWSRPYSELVTNYSALVELARKDGYDV